MRAPGPRRSRLAAVGLAAMVSAVTATAAAGQPAKLRVAAAADLKFAMDEIVAAFQQAYPGTAVHVTYGSSGSFFSQLAAGAPFDLFFSADVDYTRRLAGAGLVLPESGFVYAVGRLALCAPRDSGLDVEGLGLAALGLPSVRRVAIANPRHAPYGRAAEAALRRLGLLEEVRPKLVFGENVAQAAQFVQSGAADAGLIALSLALAPTMRENSRCVDVPLHTYPRMEQGAVILKATREGASARAFRDFVRGSRGRAVLERYGFFLPER